jgi:hypothetical protein
MTEAIYLAFLLGGWVLALCLAALAMEWFGLEDFD